MKLRNLLSVFLIVSIALIAFCFKIPTDPLENPAKARVTLFTENDMVTSGNTSAIGLIVELPHFIEVVHVFSECANIDTSIEFGSTVKMSDTIYISGLFTNSGRCTITALASLKDDTYKDVDDTLVQHVYPPDASIEYGPIPEVVFTHAGAVDTFALHAITSGSVLFPVKYSLSTGPELSKELLYPVYSPLKDTIRFVFNRLPADTYTVTAVAEVNVSGGRPVADTATFKVVSFSALVPKVTHLPRVLPEGTKDTLTVSSGEDEKIALVNTPSLQDSAIEVIEASDTLVMIAFTADGQRTIPVGIIIFNNLLADTIWYPVAFTTAKTRFWKASEVLLSATEGVPFLIDLQKYMESAEPSAVLSASSGTITGDTLHLTPEWGSEPELALTISAVSGGQSHVLNVKVAVNPGDETPPRVNLQDTNLDGKKVSSSQISVSCIVYDRSGIKKVTLVNGSDVTDALPQNDSLYVGIIKGLKHLIPSEITISANDRSMMNNHGSKTFTVTYDSTLTDGEPPQITLVESLKNGDRLTAASGSLRFVIADNSGIGEPVWKLNDSAMGNLEHLSGDTFRLSYVMTRHGSSTITVTASDKSQQSNSAVSTISLDYNSLPSEVNLSQPVDAATGIDTMPLFTWNSSDQDGDTLFHTLLVGTSASALQNIATNLKGNSFRLSPSNKLQPSTKYFWQVIGYTRSYPDTVLSKVNSFQTVLADAVAPEIEQMTGLRENERSTGSTGSIELKVTDANGVDSVYCIINTTSKIQLTAVSTDRFKLDYVFTSFGKQTLEFRAVDKSPGKNRRVLVRTLHYNTTVTAPDTLTPANDDSLVDVIPLLSWKGGNDADGDSVFYKVYYGTSATNLDKVTSELNKKSILFNSSTQLLPLTRYHWQVMAYSKKYPDTTRSTVHTFKTFDPTASDVTGPTIAKAIGPDSASRVQTGAFTYKIRVKDNNGVDSVYAKLNSQQPSVLAIGTGDTCTFTGTFTYGQNTVQFTAVDKSSNRNRRVITYGVNYNTPITAVTLSVPANTATDVAQCPVFTWTGGTDSDGDPVYYKVFYGTSASALTDSTAETTAKTFTLPQADTLSYSTQYHWRVRAFSKVNSDAVLSGTWSFTTLAAPIPTYELKYDLNGGTGQVPATASYQAGTQITLSTGSGLTNGSQVFDGWNTIANGGGSSYTGGSSLSMPSQAVTLYAQWKTVTAPMECYAYYPFNGNADDESGNSHHATVNGPVLTTDRFGRADRAYQFDGTDDYIINTNMTDFPSGKPARTIAGWFNSTNSTEGPLMMLFGYGSQSTGYNFQVGSGNYAYSKFRVNGWGVDWETDISAVGYYNGSWHHCAVTYDNDTTRLYLDGVLVKTTTAYSYSCNPQTMQTLIGVEIDLTEWNFNGKLDDILFVNRALSLTEIQNLYNATE